MFILLVSWFGVLGLGYQLAKHLVPATAGTLVIRKVAALQ